MTIKNYKTILLIIVFLLAGCSNKSINTSLQETNTSTKHLDETTSSIIKKVNTSTNESRIFRQLTYYDINYEWLDNENAIIFATKRGKLRSNPPLEIYLYDTSTKTEKLIYEGDSNSFIQEVTWGGKSNKFFNFNTDEAQKLLQSYSINMTDFKDYSKDASNPISVNGLIAGTNDTGDMVTYDTQNKITALVKPVTSKLIKPSQSYSGDQSKLIPESWYQRIRWSRDGKVLAFFEFFYSSDDILMHVANKDGSYIKSIDFGVVSDMTIAKDNESLIAVCDGTFEDNEKEIRVYSLVDNSYKTFLFEEPIDNINFSSIEILDINKPYIVLSCKILGNKSVASPLLLFNYNTGEKKWLTTPDYLPYIAKLSPNGNQLLVYGKHTNTDYNSSFTVIDIK